MQASIFIKDNVYQDCGELVSFLKEKGITFPDYHTYDDNNQNREIYSWYLVSYNFATRAKNAKYCVIDALGLHFYGRTDHGQAMDTDISFKRDLNLV